MSVPSALEFIRQVREDESLRNEIAALPPQTALESLVRMGAAAGFAFSADELQTAFKHDWKMRWLKYSAKHQYQASNETPERPGNS